MFLINTFIGFIIAQIWDVFRRNKYSNASPEKFSWSFFWKDNSVKIIVSLVLSFALSTAVYLNVGDFAKLIGSEFEQLNNIVYLLLGFAPERMLQLAKKRFGFLQPEEVEGHTRKQ